MIIISDLETILFDYRIEIMGGMAPILLQFVQKKGLIISVK